MNKLILVIDESGAKGHAKTSEKFAGEIGLMAGFILTPIQAVCLKSKLDEIYEAYKPFCNHKTHMADLDHKMRPVARSAIFNILTVLGVRWYYKAIYAEGFHQSELMEDRGGLPSNEKESLHAKLFEYMLVRAIGIAHHIKLKTLDLSIKTDHIDNGVLKLFDKRAKLILDIFSKNGVTTFKQVRDETTGAYKKEYYNTRTTSDTFSSLDNYQYNIETELSSLTFAADILANSTLHYLEKSNKGRSKPMENINSKIAIKDHPLVKLAQIPNDKEHVLPIVDIVHRRDSDIIT